MRCGHLFNGISGFGLAAHWMGWENYLHCEIDPFCNRVMNHHFPQSIQHEDIRNTDFTIYHRQLDILTGGFPCQPYSTAGKRKGKEDERHLWPEMLRAIREIQPRWVVGENVRGLTNWNGGLVFDEVQADLEAAGYEVLPFLLPAAGVNAPHRRDRIWFVAHTKSLRERSGTDCAAWDDRSRQFMEGTESGSHCDYNGESRTTSDSPGLRRERNIPAGEGVQRPEQACGETGAGSDAIASDSSSPGQRGNDGPGQTGSSQTANEGEEQWEKRDELQRQRLRGDTRGDGAKGTAADASESGLAEWVQSGECDIHETASTLPWSVLARNYSATDWSKFPTQPPVRYRNDGVPNRMVRYINPEVYAAIRKGYSIEDLQKVWQAFQSQEIREKIGRLFKIHESSLLLETLQLCSTTDYSQIVLSPFSKEASEALLRKVRKYGKFGCTSQGQKYKKQFVEQFADSLPQLSYEISLATAEIEKTLIRFFNWRAKESLKALGNAIVPQVAYQLFKAIEQL